jgi:hypothetical protein
MHDSVRNAFFDFSVGPEGYIRHMYLDKLGYVTVAVGNKIDPMSLATNLPFIHSDGSPATKDEIKFEWRKMKLNKHLAEQGAEGAAKIASLHLSDESIRKLVFTVLNGNDKNVIRTIPAFRAWPADAQLAFHSMVWAMGIGFIPHFPKFMTACYLQDWDTASKECVMNASNNKGLIPRNKANQKLLLAADNVCKTELDYATLTGWP